MKCPLCDTELPDDAQSCTKCDWVREPPRADVRACQANTRDEVAFWLSVVPGLGHLYKGHLVMGSAIFFIVGPLVLALSLSLLAGTLGLSLILPLTFMFMVMAHAYRAKDYRTRVIEKARAMNVAVAAHH
ncbi:hypothetical protein ACXR0O_19490 [Verrucomicrobiota bacterium sgz303538]